MQKTAYDITRLMMFRRKLYQSTQHETIQESLTLLQLSIGSPPDSAVGGIRIKPHMTRTTTRLHDVMVESLLRGAGPPGRSEVVVLLYRGARIPACYEIFDGLDGDRIAGRKAFHDQVLGFERRLLSV